MTLETSKETTPSSATALLSCGLYTFCSCATILANKYISFSANGSNKTSFPELSVILMQCMIAVIIMETARLMKKVEYVPLDLDLCKAWLPVNILFLGMLCSGFISFIYVNVPIITVFKNLTNLITVTGEWYLFGESVSWTTVASIVLMTIGAVMAGFNDLEFNYNGYFWMTVNCLCTASYTLYLRHATQTIKMSKFGMVYYNNLLSTVILFPLCLMKGEASMLFGGNVVTFPFLAWTMVAGVTGCMLNFASLWCVSSTSATTYAIVGSLNKIPVMLLGFVLFNAQITDRGIMFLAMAMLGGMLFAYSKLPASK